ncbi:MAG: hypothetical protein ACJA0N_000839 [Pseudohongiellaceae bacterium]|jgi:hypothetical protein
MTHHSTDQKEAIVNRFLQSGLSIREFAEDEALPNHPCIAGVRKLP